MVRCLGDRRTAPALAPESRVLLSRAGGVAGRRGHEARRDGSGYDTSGLCITENLPLSPPRLGKARKHVRVTITFESLILPATSCRPFVEQVCAMEPTCPLLLGRASKSFTPHIRIRACRVVATIPRLGSTRIGLSSTTLDWIGQSVVRFCHVVALCG